VASPNTHKEALLAELLGDVQGLLDRVEALNASIPSTVKNAQDELKLSVSQSVEHVEASTIALGRALDVLTKDTMKTAKQISAESTATAKLMQINRRRATLLLVLVPALTGAVTAALVFTAMRFASGF